MEADKAKLDTFPSSFDIAEVVKEFSENKQQMTIRKVEQEDRPDLHPIEKERNYNLLSYLYFISKNTEKAYHYNELVLRMNERNMIALANKGRFNLKTRGRVGTGILSSLDECQKDIAATISAKAEIGYFFARLGVHQYERASLLYEEVIEVCLQHGCFQTSLIIWLFGYCLAQRRLLHIRNIPLKCIIPPEERCKKLLKYYLKSLELKNKTTLKHYIARTYAELALFVSYIESRNDIFPNGLSDVMLNHEYPTHYGEEFSGFDASSVIMACFERAFDFKPEDDFVSQRLAVYLRESAEIDKCIDCLKTGARIDEHPKSAKYHFLALALKTKLENEIKKQELGDQISSETAKNMMVKTIKQAMNSPQRVITIDRDLFQEQVVEIIMYLDKALAMADNHPALYDKGLLLRQTGQFQSAVDIFIQMITDDNCTIQMKANAFEQAALCLRSKLENSTTDQYQDTIEDIKYYLKSCSEIACTLSTKDERFKDCWRAPELFIELVEKEPDSREKRDNLWEIAKCVSNDERALGILQNLFLQADTDCEKVRYIYDSAIIEAKRKNFEKSAELLDNMQNYSKADNVDSCFFKTVKIKAAAQFLKQNDFTKAKTLIKSALDVARVEVTDDYDYDVLIVCNLNDPTHGNHFMEVLNTLGFRTTNPGDPDAITHGESTIGEMDRLIPKANYILVINDFEEDEHALEYLMGIVNTKKSPNNVVLVTKGNSVPTCLENYKRRVEMDPERVRMDMNFANDDGVCCGIIGCILNVLGCKYADD